MRKDGMKIFDVITVGLLIAATITMLATFLRAYFDGMSVLVTINDHGEATTELVLLIVTIVCGIVTLVRMIRRV